MKKPLSFFFVIALLVLTVGQADASTIGLRQIFYNDSFWDNDNTGPDNSAIATDKSALLPGQTSTFANYTSFSSGTNGIMIDIAGLVGSPSSSDFTFLMGNNSDVDTWVAAPAPADIAVHLGEGVGGSDRIALIWNNSAIENQWLQVTVRTTLGLAAPDVFYFGNLVGDVNGDGQVTPFDSLVINNALDSQGTHVTDISDPLDINRDGWLSPQDALWVDNILNTPGPHSLAMFTAPETNTAVPEPAALLLLGPGLLGLVGFGKKAIFKK